MEIKGKVLHLMDDIKMCISDLKYSARELLYLINALRNVARNKINMENIISVLYTKDNLTEKD